MLILLNCDAACFDCLDLFIKKEADLQVFP